METELAPLTTPESIEIAATPRERRDGTAIAASGGVEFIERTTADVVARVHEDGDSFTVELGIIDGKLASQCTCAAGGHDLCEHAVAAALALNEQRVQPA